MRSLIVVALLLCAASVSGQSLFVDEGQTGYFFSGGLVTGDNISGYGFEIGLAGRGQIDFGVAATNSTVTVERFYTMAPGEPVFSYTNEYEAWNTGFFLREYPVRHPDPRGGEITVFLTQAMTWVSQDFIPSDNPDQWFHLGGGLAFRIPAGDKLQVYLSGSYTRQIPTDDDLDGGDVFSGGATLHIPFTGGGVVIGPEIAHTTDLTTYSINIGIISIPGENKRR